MGWARIRGRLIGSTLARQTLAYGISNGVSTLILAALGPILTHYLSPADYGIATLFNSAFALLMPLVGLGAPAALRRRYFQQHEYDYPAYVWSSVGASLVQSALITLVLVASHPLWGTPQIRWPWALVFLPWLGGRYLLSVAMVVFQARSSPLGVGALSWALSGSVVATTLTLVVGLGMGWQGRVWGQVGACAVMGVASLCVLRRLLGRAPSWRWDLARDALRFGAPGVPYSLIDRAMQYGDRVLVAAFASVGDAGLYALGAQLGALTLRVGDALNLAWQPWLFERLAAKTRADERRVVLAFYSAAAGLLVLALVFWMTVKLAFPVLIGDRYARSVSFLPWICAGVALRGMSSLLAGLVQYSGKTSSLSVISAIVAPAHLLGAAGLIFAMGPMGAAIASCLAYALRLALVWTWSRRLVPLPGL